METDLFKLFCAPIAERTDTEVFPTVLSKTVTCGDIWPFTRRWTSFKSIFYLEEDSVLQITSSHQPGATEFFGNKLPQQPANTVLASVKQNYQYFERVDKYTTKLIEISDLDFGLNWPRCFLNMINKSSTVDDTPGVKAKYLEGLSGVRTKLDEKRAHYDDLFSIC